MEAVRKEIMPFVELTCLRTDKFKTGCLSINLLTRLCRENASKNALIPHVLRRGSTGHPDMESISAALDELYGARIEPVVRKKGEVQAVGFFADFADDAFVPGGERVLEKVAALMGELLLSPNTRGGLFLPAYVDSEREKLLERLRARINDKRSYAVQRLFELMCFGEDYATDRMGTEEEAESINYQKLTRHYKQLLQSAPIEVFYCGSADPLRVERAVKSALVTLLRGEPDDDIGTDIRINTVEENPRYFTEELSVTQGKLAVGFRLGECMYNPNMAAIRVFNAVYGGSVTSKLFMNVRERLSLCYYASSAIDRHKGLMVVSSGIEFDKYDAALSEIFAQLDAVKRGDITDEELVAARKAVATELRSAMDTPGALEDFWLSQNIDGLDYGPEELAALAEIVTRDEVVEVAKGVECDAVYFLRGLSEEGEKANGD
ncbi:MAG: EF-P 5-aminopentanol modification-associated protein YfmF [Oscillospiraceae bacterium]|jgi:predicted Zn-dependent peptidase